MWASAVSKYSDNIDFPPLYSHLIKYDTQCPKMFPLLIRAEISERKMERKALLMVAVPIVEVRRCLGNKSSTVASLSFSI